MNYIYHEKQEGSLCGQHCLNNLLQGSFFTAVELAELAQKVDTQEMQYMSEFGTNTDDFQRYAEQPSANMDDSGMFSIQVIAAALKIWGLALVPYSSSSDAAIAARDNVIGQQAYICNFREHWFTVRKLGNQWFNLNSLLSYPELISDTYLSLFLTQLQHENYSIFVVDGTIPPSQADDFLKVTPAVQTIKPKLLSELGDSGSKEEEDIEAALLASLNKDKDEGRPSLSNVSSEQSLQAAIEMSLKEQEDDMQKAIQLSLQVEEKICQPSKSSEDEELEKALQMSLDDSLCNAKAPKTGFEDAKDDL